MSISPIKLPKQGEENLMDEEDEPEIVDFNNSVLKMATQDK